MIKLLFHEGGQPISLDDFKQLQDTPLDQFKALLSVLTGGEKTFLMLPATAELITAEPGNTVFKTNKNWLVEDGIIYPIAETTFTVATWYETLYVGVRKNNVDVRVFEDGQENACREIAETYLTLEKTDGVYDIHKLKNLFGLMAPLVAGKTPVAEYKDIHVDFINGYSGEVQYKEERDYYRIRIKLSSKNFAWMENTAGSIFVLADTAPRWVNERASTLFMTGGDTSARAQSAHLEIKGNIAFLCGDIDLERNKPADCQITTYIDIPK